MFTIEHTDTYAGEANYNWCHRRFYIPEGKPLTRLTKVKLAKKIAGFTGLRCKVTDFGDMISIKPTRMCQIAFIRWEDDRPEARRYWKKQVDRNGNEVEESEEE